MADRGVATNLKSQDPALIVTPEDTPEEATVKREKILKKNLISVLGTNQIALIDMTDLTSVSQTASATLRERAVV